MNEHDGALADLGVARERFLALVNDIRPDLHRYCARMTGSVMDGEDIVQDVLARAFFELSALKQLPAMRAWLFRIAHNRALDYLRRYEQRMREPLDAVVDRAADTVPDPEDALIRDEALHATLSRFLELPSAQRSCVILKDVLGYSLDDISGMLDMSVPAVKAALHRGRQRLRAAAATPLPPPSSRSSRRISPTLARYADLFNARDWDGVRSMLVDEVKLDLVSHSRRFGRRDVEVYFTNYNRLTGWRMSPGWVDGREALIVTRESTGAPSRYFVELTYVDGRVTAIRDFNHVPYIGEDATVDEGAPTRHEHA
jgi:RNA polymerase sigma factor (sigma-70 family)